MIDRREIGTAIEESEKGTEIFLFPHYPTVTFSQLNRRVLRLTSVRRDDATLEWLDQRFSSSGPVLKSSIVTAPHFP